MCSDDTSYLAANPSLSKYTTSQLQQQQQRTQAQTPTSMNLNGKQLTAPSSLVIREKKLTSKTPTNAEYANVPMAGISAKTSGNFDEWSTASSHYYANFQQNLHAGNEDPAETVADETRNKNYQELSESINDLFSNLLRHLEKQKNKEYLINSDDTAIGLNTSQPAVKKDSNKDSGFNQESFYISNKINGQGPVPTATTESVIRKLEKNSDFNASAPIGGQHHFLNSQNASSSEFSLLERYLNNEQLVANKHAQVEQLLDSWMQQQCDPAIANSLLIDDYSVIDYILSQEGISMRTFAQLIREKFVYIEWPREILVELYRIVNGEIYESEDDNTINGHTDKNSSGYYSLKFWKINKLFELA